MVNEELTRFTREVASKEFKSYFKYCGDDPEVIESIFERQEIRFTQPWALNDPLEFNPTMRFNDPGAKYRSFELDGVLLPSIELFYRVQVIESQINAYGILSVTKIPDSFDMWCRYSNGHKGFMIELKSDFFEQSCMRSENGGTYGVHKVEYVDDYAINLENLVDANNDIPVKLLHRELFFKKTSRWKDENEYRMVRPLTDCPKYVPPKSNYTYRDDNVYLFDFSRECIESVVFGARMSIGNKKLIAHHCRRHNILLYQAFIVRDQKDRFGKPANVILIGVDSLSPGTNILQSKPYVFCTDTVTLTQSKTKLVKVTKLSDLPYYAGYENVVEEYYRNAIEGN